MADSAAAAAAAQVNAPASRVQPELVRPEDSAVAVAAAVLSQVPPE
jgi:hypothetical protein